ncbi:unnamed protein product [Timema podura]|uniref:Uncharacterized protein n=1 Tax=Timema podura TaxID=61482 RepID=A0ABN7NRY7_TIMPD|nr:unnamed protein product [Timema podura]
MTWFGVDVGSANKTAFHTDHVHMQDIYGISMWERGQYRELCDDKCIVYRLVSDDKPKILAVTGSPEFPYPSDDSRNSGNMEANKVDSIHQEAFLPFTQLEDL